MPVELEDERTDRTAWISELQVPVSAIKIFEEESVRRKAFPSPMAPLRRYV
jgi:hypothetical protein